VVWGLVAKAFVPAIGNIINLMVTSRERKKKGKHVKKKVKKRGRNAVPRKKPHKAEGGGDYDKRSCWLMRPGKEWKGKKGNRGGPTSRFL